MTTLTIPLSRIISKGNIRELKDSDVQDIVSSFREQGQEVPITVWETETGEYAIKFGHRRVRAASILGWSDIRAVVEDEPATAIDLFIGQFIENEDRKNLTYMEKARVYGMLKESGLTQVDIARMFGKSEVDVSCAIKTLKASPKLQKAVEDGLIKPSAIEPLLSQPMEVQEELADAALRAKTVRNITKLVKAHNRRAELTSEIATTYGDDSTPLVPEDADPLEVITLEQLAAAAKALEDAVQSMAMFPVTHPELAWKANVSIASLLRQAESLKEFLETETA